ncbi:hypothetical protein [Spongiactinospora rosea]|nr:hypothetical protein [Spongiactinospora rosea]
MGTLAAALADGKTLPVALSAALAAVAGGFAPTVLDRLRERRAAIECSDGVAEQLPADSPADLLRPWRRVVPFEGREHELAELAAWCRADDAGTGEAGWFRLVIGAGGIGRSRLAIELGLRLREHGWQVIHVADDREVQALSEWRAGRGEWDRPVLLVNDYAETRADLPGLLVDVAADDTGRVRVLLLARSAGEWWQRLGGESAAVRRLIYDAGRASPCPSR